MLDSTTWKFPLQQDFSEPLHAQILCQQNTWNNIPKCEHWLFHEYRTGVEWNQWALQESRKEGQNMQWFPGLRKVPFSLQNLRVYLSVYTLYIYIHDLYSWIYFHVCFRLRKGDCMLHQSMFESYWKKHQTSLNIYSYCHQHYNHSHSWRLSLSYRILERLCYHFF